MRALVYSALFLLHLPAWAETRADFGNAVAIGTFNGFYRGTQLQGHLLRDRLGLTKVPSSLLKTSFPYRARPFPEEVLFADTLSFVRFLGGWKPAWNAGEARGKDGDLAWRDKDGKVRYRWELVAPRIDPYLKAGYRNLIISLDNVPWALADGAADGAYGQVSPPRDLNEWGAFIEEFCRELVKLYGKELPNSWSFRMGTEPNGAPGHTFSGGHEKYVAMYDVTAKAVKRVLPGARFGPGEFSGSMGPVGPEPPFVNHVKLAEHCFRTGIPFDFLANSAHCVPRWNGRQLRGAADPRERVTMNLSSYRNVLAADPAFAGPIYIFQFGVLRSELRDGGDYLSTNEPGGRGAAWTFHVLMDMKAKEKRLKGIWHWAAGEQFDRRDPESFLLYGNGWLYSILDHCIGGSAYVLDAQPSSLGTLYKLLFVSKGPVSYLLISAFNSDRRVKKAESVRISVPAKLIGAHEGVSARSVTLSESNAPYRAIKDDLARQHLLKPGYAEFDLLASVREMSGAKGLAYVARNFSKYVQLQTESLTLKPLAGDFAQAGGIYELKLTMEPGSVTAISLRN